ncbi:hypothetical protein [Sorangium sp. So ce693]|uniref:hypothetical protein n=1 Tax=Sorangium sp. So ce693 TaxID=3133318 RepID=UPI003F61E924
MVLAMSTGSAPPILLPVAERARNNALFAASTLVASACAADSPLWCDRQPEQPTERLVNDPGRHLVP